MKIKALKLNNFRNYERVQLNFQDSLNIFYGNNGVGKTNLVEAIYVLALTKSFRTNNDRHLIKVNELSTKIEGEVENNIERNYQVIINKEGKKVKIDNDIISKMSDYIVNIQIVLLEPDEQTIFSDSPSVRRKLLNVEISQLQKEYIVYLNNYNKLLKQRNSYIKKLDVNKLADYDYLNILTKKLIEYGLKIYEFRKDFIEKINLYIEKCYCDIFEYGNLLIKYNSEYANKSKEELYEMYQKNYSKEIILGKTLLGIHHDDLIFLLDKKNIAEWGSNGQQKNAIFAFKLAEIKVIYEKFGEYPILILDDLFSALDNKKVENIVSLINRDIQTFITTTELDRISDSLLKDAKLFNVTFGNIEEVYYGR